jgi:hypothetical protein
VRVKDRKLDIMRLMYVFYLSTTEVSFHPTSISNCQARSPERAAVREPAAAAAELGSGHLLEKQQARTAISARELVWCHGGKFGNQLHMKQILATMVHV